MLKKHKWLAPVLFVALVALTILVVAGQSKTFTAEGFIAYVKSVRPWGLITAVGCMLCYILFEGLALLETCRALGYRRGWRRGVLYSAADIYFSAITPSATGGQPASALLMIGDGIPAAVTTVALLLNLLLYTLSIFVITLAGLALSPGALGMFGVPARLLMVVGAALQLALIGGILLLIFKENIFLKLVDVFLRLGEKLRLVRNAEARKEKLLQVEADYQASAGVIRRHLPALSGAFVLNILQRLSIVLVPVVLYAASVPAPRSLRRAFAAQTWVIMGSNSVPLPGAVGVADYLFLDGYGALMPDPVNLELLSRTVSFYCCVLLCAVILLLSFITQKASRK